MPASADALRVQQLFQQLGNVHDVASVLGVTPAEIAAIRRDPSLTLDLPGGGAGDRAVWKPPYGSLKAAVQDPALAISRANLNVSTLYLSRVYIADPIDLVNVHWIPTAGSTGLTKAELGVYNSSLQLLAKTGDVKAQFNGTTGPKSAPLTAVGGRSQHVGGEGEWLYVGHYQVGGSVVAALAGWNLAVAGIALLDGSPPRATSRGSTTVLPDPIDPLDIAAGGSLNLLWYGLS